MFRKNKLVSLLLSSFSYLPAPINISFWWNWGSMASVTLILQFLTSIFLTMHYISDIGHAFDSVSHIDRDVYGGWMLRSAHANSASLFLFCVFLHISRGLYYKSYTLKYIWVVSVILLILSMLTAFFSYVLPWSQMSFWGATVITNFLSVIPFYGNDIVMWIWSGFSVSSPTLTRFYTFHFLFPFLIIVFSLLHLVFLHRGGSSNPLKLTSNMSKMYFWPYSSIKDLFGFFMVFSLYFLIVLYLPNYFSDPENFMKANPMVTPVHIKPEWYFLFAYAILRCIPNKTMGVIALVMSILMLMFLPFLQMFSQKMYMKTSSFLYQICFWVFSINFMLLTWLGGAPVEDPYILMSQICSFIYFLSLLLLSFYKYLKSIMLIMVILQVTEPILAFNLCYVMILFI